MTFVGIGQKCYGVTIDGIVDLINTSKLVVVGIILPIIDGEISKIYRLLTRLAGGILHLRRGNFFTSRVHLNPTISTQVKYFALLQNIHSCLNLVIQDGGHGGIASPKNAEKMLLHPKT